MPQQATAKSIWIVQPHSVAAGTRIPVIQLYIRTTGVCNPCWYSFPYTCNCIPDMLGLCSPISLNLLLFQSDHLLVIPVFTVRNFSFWIIDIFFSPRISSSINEVSTSISSPSPNFNYSCCFFRSKYWFLSSSADKPALPSSYHPARSAVLYYFPSLILPGNTAKPGFL